MSESIKNVYVFGAGALGSYVGAAVSRALPVTLIGRKPHMDAIAHEGLRIAGSIDEKVALDTATKLPAVGSGDLVIVSVKAHDTLEAGKAIQDQVQQTGPIVISIQNGLGTQDLLRRLVSSAGEVLRGLASLGCTLVRPGHIEFWGGSLVLEPGPAASTLVDLFTRCGIQTEVSENFERAEWMKWILNCVNNPLTALLGVRNKDVATKKLAPVREMIASECATIADASGVHLIEPVLEQIDSYLVTSNNRSSMLQDVEAGRRTEIDAFNGEAVRRAKQLDLQAPLNEALAALVHAQEDARGVDRHD